MADAKISALASHGTPVAADYVASVLDSGPTSKKLLLSDLQNFVLQAFGGGSEISVTTTTTATIGRMHHCTGTSGDYTVTLPAASGNAGKMIGFRMGAAAALTKLVTIDGNASETIDGATTRIMWATETAILLCDGSNWFKVAGKTVPMQCQLAKTSYQAIGTATMTDVTLERADVDNVGLMADLANDRILIVRPGKYLIMSHLMWSDSAAAVQRMIGQIYNSNTTTAITAAETTAYTSGVWAVCQAYCLADLLTTSTIKLQAYTTDASPDVYGVGSGDTTQILIIEQPSW